MTGKILIEVLTSGLLHRENDNFMMDVWDAQNLSIQILQHLNLCPLYQRVKQLSKIVTNDGFHIQECYLLGTKINEFTHTEWPR